MGGKRGSVRPAVVAVLAGLGTVVAPHPGRAVVTVARFGSTVRLLPDRLSLAFLPLASRVALPQSDGCAVIETRVSLPLGAGAVAEATARLLVLGAGPSRPCRIAPRRRDAGPGAPVVNPSGT